MKASADQLRGQLIDQCDQLTDHVKLLRDYATTPGNVWLARGELNRLGELSGEIETLLTRIQQDEKDHPTA